MQISCKDLKFTFNKKSKFPTVALNGITLDIKEGETVGIIGHTGSGKSTFIQHINRLIEVDEGLLTVGKYNLSPKTRKEKKTLKKELRELRKGVGMVFQYPEYQLFAESVYADCAFGVRQFYPEISEEQVALKVQNALEQVGLDYFAVKDKSPFEMSGGQKRRVAIAGVIATCPEILVLDEPLAGLDPSGKADLMELIKDVKRTACKTVIIVSHDMDEVCDNCDRVIVFSDGKVELDGTPKQVFSQAEKLKELRMDCPVTANVTRYLAERGIRVDNDYSVDGFVSAVVKAVKDE